MAKHQDRISRLLTITPVNWQRGAPASGIMYVYILYLRREDTTLAILHTGLYLRITTTVAGEWLNSLLFHDDIKYILQLMMDR